MKVGSQIHAVGGGKGEGKPSPSNYLTKASTAFEMSLGPHFESFLGVDGLDSMFFSGLLQGHFLHRCLIGNLDKWISLNNFFVYNVLQKKIQQILFLMIRGSNFSVFRRPWEHFLLTFTAWETGLKLECFSVSFWGS